VRRTGCLIIRQRARWRLERRGYFNERTKSVNKLPHGRLLIGQRSATSVSPVIPLSRTESWHRPKSWKSGERGEALTRERRRRGTQCILALISLPCQLSRILALKRYLNCAPTEIHTDRKIYIISKFSSEFLVEEHLLSVPSVFNVDSLGFVADVI